MAIALVQKSASWPSAATSVTATLPASSTAGNLLVAHIVMANPGTPTVPSNWIKAGSGTSQYAFIYYYPNNPGGLSSFNFSFGSNMSVLISEWSGVDTASPFDTSGYNSGAASPVTATTTGNVSASSELAVGVIAENETKSGTTTLGAGTGWTDLLDNGGTSSFNHGLASYQLNPTSGATLSEAGSTSSMNLNNLSAAIAVFKPAPLLVQQVTAMDSTGSVGSVSATFSSNNTAGNMLYAVIGSANGASNSNITGLSDTNGNTWTKIADSNTNQADGLQVWVAYNCKASTTPPTVSVNDGSFATALAIGEVQGVATSSAFDQQSITEVTGTNPSGGTTSTLNANNDFVLAVVVSGAHNGTAYTVGSGYSNFSPQAGTWVDFGVESKTVYPTTGVTASFGGGTAGVVNKVGIFTFSTTAVSSGSTLTNTQSAVARIANNITKTQSATARIQRALTKIQSAVARVANVVTKTQSAVARISNTKTSTQPAVARIQMQVTKAQPATARIVFVLTKTQSALARIAQTYTKTQLGVARVANTVTKTQSAISRIAVVTTKTQSALGRISNTLSKTQSATATITTASTNTKTQPAVARIANTLTKTQTAIARIATVLTKTQSATARIQRILTKTQPAVARVANTVSKTQPAVARIAAISTKTQGALARIANALSKTQPAVARISNTFTKTQGAVARISNTPTKTQSAVARIQQRLFFTQSATASITQSGVSTKTQSATARIQMAVVKTQAALARIATQLSKTQAATARLAQIYTKTQTAVSRIAQTYTKTQPAKARIASTLTSTQPSVARIQVVAIKTQPAVSRISQTYTKTQSATSRISETFTKVQSAIARVAEQLTHSQPALARIERVMSATQSCTARIAIAAEYFPIPSLVLSQSDTLATLRAIDSLSPTLSQSDDTPTLGAHEDVPILSQSDTNGAVL